MIRGFIILSQSWYADANLRGARYVDEVNFGMYAADEDGGTTGEMSVKWYDLGGGILNDKPVPKLECFDDAWATLVMFSDVIAELGKVDNANITPDEFAEILKGCGFKDMTKRPEKIEIYYDLYGYASEADFENGRNREHLGSYESMTDALFERQYYLKGGEAWGEPRAVIKAISSDDEEIEIVRRRHLCPYHKDGLGWDECSDWFEGECQVEEARKAENNS